MDPRAGEYVDGHTAAELIADRYRNGMPFELVARIVWAIGAALDGAHRRGVVHGDLRPLSIVVFDGKEPRILLADFESKRNVEADTTVDAVAFAAPERLVGYDVDPRADQYSLAAIAYHLLTGAPPYPESTAAAIVSRHLHAAPPKIADPRGDLSGLNSVLAVALSKYPQGRFATCTDFAYAFTQRGLANAPAGLRSAGKNLRHRTRWLPSMASVVLIASAATIFAWQPWGHHGGRSAMAATSGFAPTSPASLDGIYTADFGPELQLGDGALLNSTGARGAFEIRSVCKPTGCVAVAEASGGPTLQRRLVFDDVEGQWIAVDTATSTSPAISPGLKAGCEQGLSPEVWETVLLKPQPDGTLSGRYEVANANNCNASRTITMRRTGDVDVAAVDDPADLPPRISSPAQAFQGHYRYTYGKGSDSHDESGYVRTDCLRTGERCVSDFNGPNSAEPFVFSGGRWTLHYAAPVACGDVGGPTVTINRSAELALPQPTSDPIDLLVGRGTETVTRGPCVVPPSTYQLRFQRTGD
jgi:serine/threonine protein kinase, bacterial